MGVAMKTTVVLSGPAVNRAKAVSQLQRMGIEVDPTEETHGYEPIPEHTFITAHAKHPDHALDAIKHLEFTLRSHWVRTDDWKKVGSNEDSGTLKEIARLKSQLRANGLILPD